jgi:phage tail tube protein FII
MKGSFDFEGDTTKIKEAKKGKIKFYPQQYTKEIDGKEVAFIDLVAPIFRVNGRDLLEDTRVSIQ